MDFDRKVYAENPFYRDSRMHEDLRKESPYNMKIVMKPHKYKYGKYTFVM